MDDSYIDYNFCHYCIERIQRANTFPSSGFSLCRCIYSAVFRFIQSEAMRNTAVLGAVLGVASGVPFFIQNKLFIAFLIPIFVSAGICILGNKFALLEAAEEMKAL